MSTEVLGSLSFLTTPEVTGTAGAVTNSGGVPDFMADVTANRPTAGAGPLGRIFLDTTLNRFYRDDGAVWVDLTPVLLLDGTTAEIVVQDGTNVTPSIVGLANNAILPGTARMRIPSGTTAQRPGSPVGGDLRYNETLGYAETYEGDFWAPVGRLLQRLSVNVPGTSGTSTFTIASVLPTTATMATSILTQAFTPISTTSTVVVRWRGIVGCGTAARSVLLSLFSDTTHRQSAANLCATTNSAYGVGIQASWVPGSTATISITLRAAVSGGAATWYVNQAGTNTLGGGFASQLTIEEYA